MREPAVQRNGKMSSISLSRNAASYLSRRRLRTPKVHIAHFTLSSLLPPRC
jgi:hypothetical protein